jgi:hypothetical protein
MHDFFREHLPAKFKDRAPRVIRRENGTDAWLIEGKEIATFGLDAVAGRVPGEWGSTASNPARALILCRSRRTTSSPSMAASPSAARSSPACEVGACTGGPNTEVGSGAAHHGLDEGRLEAVREPRAYVAGVGDDADAVDVTGSRAAQEHHDVGLLLGRRWLDAD